MTPGSFVKGMKKMLKANNKPSERHKSTATSGEKDITTALGTTSQLERKAKFETPGSGNSIDEESVSAQPQASRKTHSLPNFTEEQLRAASWSSSQQSQDVPLISNRQRSPLLEAQPDSVPILPHPNLQELLSAPPLVDLRAKAAALRHNNARQEQEEQRRSRHAADVASIRSMPVDPASTPRFEQEPPPDRRNAREALAVQLQMPPERLLDTLEFPEQEQELGPPPKGEGLRGRSNAKQAAGKDLLATFEAQMDSLGRPLHNRSPIRHRHAQPPASVRSHRSTTSQQPSSRELAGRKEGKHHRSRSGLEPKDSVKDYRPMSARQTLRHDTHLDDQRSGMTTARMWRGYGEVGYSPSVATPNHRVEHCSNRKERALESGGRRSSAADCFAAQGQRARTQASEWPDAFEASREGVDTAGSQSEYQVAVLSTFSRHSSPPHRPDNVAAALLRSRSAFPDVLEGMDFGDSPVPSARPRMPVYASPGDRLPVQEFPDKGYPADLPPGSPYLGEWRQEAARRHGMRIQSGARSSASEYRPSHYSRMGGPRLPPHVLRELRVGRDPEVADETLYWSLKQPSSGMPHYEQGVEGEGGQYGSQYSRETHAEHPGHPSSRDLVCSHYDAADRAAMRMQTVPVGHPRERSEGSLGGWPSSHVRRDYRGDHSARSERPAWEEYGEQTPPSYASRVPQDAFRRSERHRTDAMIQLRGRRESEAARFCRERGTGIAATRSEAYFPMSGMREQDFDVTSAASQSETNFQYSQGGDYSRPLAHEMGRHAAMLSTREAADARDAQEWRLHQHNMTAESSPPAHIGSRNRKEAACNIRSHPPVSDSGSGRLLDSRQDAGNSTGAVEVVTPEPEEEPARRWSYSPPTPHVEAAMQAAERQIESLRSKLKTQRAVAETLLASQTLPSTPSADQNSCPDEELAELRRVVAFLQSKMAGLENELHTTREKQASENAERDATHEELQRLQERLRDAEGGKAELITLVTELRGNLERAVGEKAAELQQMQAALRAAQADALHQEELAEMAKGELDEYRRRMAAEVEHARCEALKLVSGQSGQPGKLHEEICRAKAAAAQAKQERDSLNGRLAANNQKRAELEDSVQQLLDEMGALKSAARALEDKMAGLERERAEQEVACKEAETKCAAAEAERQQMAAMQAEYSALKVALEKAQQGGGSREAPLFPASKRYNELVEDSILDSLELERDLSGFEMNGFCARDKFLEEAQRKNADLEHRVTSANQVARKAAEEKAELLTEASQLRAQLSACNGELQRLHEVEGLADDALKALEAQTQEAIRLRSHAAELEETLQQKEAQLEEALDRQNVLEEAIADRDAKIFEKSGNSWPPKDLSDLRKAYVGAQILRDNGDHGSLSGLSTPEISAVLGNATSRQQAEASLHADSELRSGREQTAVKLAQAAYKRAAQAEAENIMLRKRLAE